MRQSYGSIYIITNNLNGKSYVGQTTGPIIKRFHDHCLETRNNRHISSAIRKYGVQNFTLTKLAEAYSREELNDLERKFVIELKSMHPAGYNHRAGGNQRGICSAETKLKISQAKIGKKVPLLKNRIIPNKQRLEISQSLGGRIIIGVHQKAQKILIYQTAHSTRKDGHNPSNVVQICKNKGRRTVSKGFRFYYIENFFENLEFWKRNGAVFQATELLTSKVYSSGLSEIKPS